MACALLLSGSAAAQVTWSPLLGDSMVLQRGQPIPLSGNAEPGADVVVRFEGKEFRALASAGGKWQLELPAMEARSEPFALTATAAEATAALRDIVVGDVWICAGQSNMAFPVSQAESPAEPALGLRYFQAEYAGVGEGRAWNEAKVSRLGPEQFVQGEWSRSDSDSLPGMSAVAHFFGAALHAEIEVPIGLVDLAAGGTPAEAWMPRSALLDHPVTSEMLEGSWLTNTRLEPWCQKRATLNLSQVEDPPGDALGPYHAFRPSYLWETATSSWLERPITGVLWYQGESNSESAWRVEQHELLFPRLIESWRQAADRPELPFLYVQLPSMGRANWPEFREQQRLLETELRAVGMAVTIDVGHPTNVHPRRKKPVGERLARLAMHIVYGSKDPGAGPRLQTVRVTGEEFVLEFDGEFNVTESQGFELVMDSGEVRAVSAKVHGTRVHLPRVADAKSIRYAWAPVPIADLRSVRGPASPFRWDLD